MAIAWGLFYSECVGPALVAGCLLLMVRERWVWAGVVGALATATNPAALPLVLAALVPTVQALHQHERCRGRCPLSCSYPRDSWPTSCIWGSSPTYALYWWHLNHQAWDTSVDFGKSLLTLLPHFWKLGLPGPAWLEWMGLFAVVGAVIALVRAKAPGTDQRLLHRCPRCCSS